MDKIALIKKAISRGHAQQSQLHGTGVMSIGGFTSDGIRHLLNNLGGIATSYLEVGVHMGSTFCSTIFGNKNLLHRIAVDNWSEFNNDGMTRLTFVQNVREHAEHNYAIIEKNCFDITPEELAALAPAAKPDLYLYDGGHDYESQRKAVTHFAPMLADEFTLCVDDFSWQDVRRGTFDGIRDAGLDILYVQELFSGKEADCDKGGWWNGFGVFLLKKK